MALLVGSGVSSSVLPRIAGLLDLADEYAQNRADSGDLTTALRRARAAHDAPTLTSPPDGANDVHGPPDDSIRVYHLHGFWRPIGNGHRRLLHDVPYPLERHPPALLDWVRRLIWADTVCVIGYSGWDCLFLDALREVTRTGRILRVLWAAHTADNAARTRLAGWLRERTGCTVEVFGGVDSDTALPTVATSLGLMPARTAPTRHRIRHLGWERELSSEQGIAPPPGCPDLLRQLDRRVPGGRAGAGGPPPPPPPPPLRPARRRGPPPPRGPP